MGRFFKKILLFVIIVCVLYMGHAFARLELPPVLALESLEVDFEATIFDDTDPQNSQTFQLFGNSRGSRAGFRSTRENIIREQKETKPTMSDFEKKQRFIIPDQGEHKDEKISKHSVIVKYKTDSVGPVPLADSDTSVLEVLKTSEIDVQQEFQTEEEMELFLEELRKDPNVAFAEPNYVLELMTSSNDSLYSQQWALPQTHVNNAWSQTIGNEDLLIAVLDTGLDANHPDAPRFVKFEKDFVSNETFPQDRHGHGTAVAGVIAAHTNNAKGIAGVCHDCTIMPVKVLDDKGFGTYADVAAGIVYAVDNGADVVHMSLGGTSYSRILSEAVQYAFDHGVVVVASAGNNAAQQKFYPAAFANVIGVGASDQTDALWFRSNTGSHVDIVAPGVDILSLTLGYDYALYTGTSMSAAFVTGAVALYRSHETEKTPAQVAEALSQSVVDLGDPGKDESFGYGRLDFAKLFTSQVDKGIEEVPIAPEVEVDEAVMILNQLNIIYSEESIEHFLEEQQSGLSTYTRISPDGDVSSFSHLLMSMTDGPGFSINPRVLLTFMELLSGSVTKDTITDQDLGISFRTDREMLRSFLKRTAEREISDDDVEFDAEFPLDVLYAQLTPVAAEIGFHWSCAQANETAARDCYQSVLTFADGAERTLPTSINPETYALMVVLSKLATTVEEWDTWVSRDAGSFYHTYANWFGSPVREVLPLANPDPVPVKPFLTSKPYGDGKVYNINSSLDHNIPVTSLLGNDNKMLTLFGSETSNASLYDCFQGIDCYDGHDGIDYSTKTDLIVASADGKVAYKQDYYGKTVSLLHKSDPSLGNYDFMTTYSHLDDYFTSDTQTDELKLNVIVDAGKRIGTSGKTGLSYVDKKGIKREGGPHLHFSVRKIVALKDVNASPSKHKIVDPYGWWALAEDPSNNLWNTDVHSWLWKGDTVVDNHDVSFQHFNFSSNQWDKITITNAQGGDVLKSTTKMYADGFSGKNEKYRWKNSAFWVASFDRGVSASKRHEVFVHIPKPEDTQSMTNEVYYRIYGTDGLRSNSADYDRFCTEYYGETNPSVQLNTTNCVMVKVDQRANQGTWVSLGVYTFVEGGNIPAVRLYDEVIDPTQDGKTLWADAVKWEPYGAGVDLAIEQSTLSSWENSSPIGPYPESSPSKYGLTVRVRNQGLTDSPEALLCFTLADDCLHSGVIPVLKPGISIDVSILLPQEAFDYVSLFIKAQESLGQKVELNTIMAFMKIDLPSDENPVNDVQNILLYQIPGIVCENNITLICDDVIEPPVINLIQQLFDAIKAIGGGGIDASVADEPYVFTPAFTGNYVMYSTGNTAILSAVLKDSNGDVVVADYAQSAEGENFRLESLLEEGVRYSLIIEYETGASGDYRIKVNSPDVYIENFPEPPSYDTAGAQEIFAVSSAVNTDQVLYVFTPTKNGDHTFYSKGSVAMDRVWLFDPLHTPNRIWDYDAQQLAAGENFRVGGQLVAGTKYYLYVGYAPNQNGNYKINMIEPLRSGDIGDGSSGQVDHLDDLHDFDHEYPEVSDAGYQFWDAGRIDIGTEKAFSIHVNETAVYSFSLYYDSQPMFFEIKDIAGEGGVFLVRDKKTKEFQIEASFSVGLDQFDPTARLTLNQLQAGVEYEMLITSRSGDIQANALLKYRYPLSFENPGDDVPNIPLYSDAGKYTYEPARILIGDQFEHRFAFQTNDVDVFIDADMFMVEPDRYGLYEMTMNASSPVSVHFYANCHKQQFMYPQSFTFEANQSESQTIHITPDFGSYFCFSLSGVDDDYAFTFKRHSSVNDGDDYPDTSFDAKILEGASIRGRIDADTDVDVFSFISPRSASYHLGTNFPVEILDMIDHPVHRYSTSTEQNIEFFLKEGQEYQFRVSGVAGDQYQFTLNNASPSYPEYRRQGSDDDRSAELDTVVFKQASVDPYGDSGTGRFSYSGSATIAPGEVQYWHSLGGASQVTVTPLGDQQQKLIGEVVAPNGMVTQLSSSLWTNPNGFSLIPNANGAHYRVYNSGTESVTYVFHWTNFYGDDFYEEEVVPNLVVNAQLDPEIVYGRGYRAVGYDSFFFTAEEDGVMLAEFHSNTVGNDMVFITDERGNSLKSIGNTSKSYLFGVDKGKKYQVQVYHAARSGTALLAYNFALHSLPVSFFSDAEIQAMPISPNILPEIDIQVSTDDIYRGDLIVFDASGSTDADGEIVSYEWLIDGQVFNGPLAEYLFSSGGSYPVQLTIIDNKGDEVTSTVTYQVSDVLLPPVLQMFPKQEIYVGTHVSFDASARSDSDFLQRTYEWSLNGVPWDGVTGDTGVFAFDTMGDYEVSVVLREANGNFVSDSLSFTVTERPNGDDSASLAHLLNFQMLQGGYGSFYSGQAEVQNIDRSGDVDYFLGLPPGDGTYEFTTYSPEDADLKADLLDVNEQLIQSDDNYGQGLNFKLIASLKKGERYYVRVMHTDAAVATGSYYLRQQSYMDDHGNSDTQASVLEIGVPIPASLCYSAAGTGCNYGGDVDYFRYTPTVSGEHFIGTTGMGSFLGGTGLSGNISKREQLIAGQTYFLALQGINTYVRGNYEVFVLPVKDDHYDISAAATVLEVNTPVMAQIDDDQDQDWFTYSFPKVMPGDEYSVLLTGSVFAEVIQGGRLTTLTVGQDSSVNSSDGPLLVRVFGTPGAYTLKLVMVNNDDHGNNGSTATELSYYGNASGVHEVSNDVDAFLWKDVRTSGSCGYKNVSMTASSSVQFTYYSSLSPLSGVPWLTTYNINDPGYYSTFNASGTTFVIPVHTCPGQYNYLRVAPLSGVGGGTYSFSIN
jgi:murein DD-endopeptidase MepM/ murein hydrolase activator NlpD